MQREELERMSREQLIAEAERLGIPRPRVLTQPELVDEIIGRTAKSERERAKARGWLGRARDLLARVVDRGLHLPEAARVIRREAEEKGWPTPPPPMPTVTLAEIYAAQGHLERAIAVLDEVLAREPDHREAKAMRARFAEQVQRSRARAAKEKETPSKPEPAPAPAAPASSPAAIAASPAAPAASPAKPAAQSAPTTTVREATPARPAEEPAASASPLPGEEPAPKDVLEEPPLPDRYEVDEVVAIAVDPRTIYLYWEVRPTTLAHARARHPEGALSVRVATVMASWEGPVVDTRDLRVDALYGDRFLREIQPGSNVRVSVGWASAAGFEPFAVAAEVTSPRAVPVESVAQEVARWEAEPVVAPFQHRRAEPAGRSAQRTSLRRAPERRASAFAAAGPNAWNEGAPVDTGFALWGPPTSGAVPAEGELLLEEDEVEVLETLPGWFEPGGSSELGRGGPLTRRRLVKVPRAARASLPGAPGASELFAYGGASEGSR